MFISILEIHINGIFFWKDWPKLYLNLNDYKSVELFPIRI